VVYEEDAIGDEWLKEAALLFAYLFRDKQEKNHEEQ